LAVPVHENGRTLLVVVETWEMRSCRGLELQAQHTPWRRGSGVDVWA
jgi:hypothetical protein